MLDKIASLYLCPFLNFLLFILTMISAPARSQSLLTAVFLLVKMSESLCNFFTSLLFSFFLTSFLPFFRLFLSVLLSLLYLWDLVLVRAWVLS